MLQMQRTHPRFGRYIVNYERGRVLVRAFLDRAADRDAAYRWLPAEQWTPTRLRSAG